MIEQVPARKSALFAFLVWVLATLFWWGLAFFPTPSTNPEWLDVARKVCFGTMEDGLPNAAGWMVLILGPFSFLVAYLFTWPGEITKWTKIAWRTPFAVGKILVFMLALSFVVEGYWTYNKVQTGLAISNFDFSNPDAQEFPEDYPRTRLPATNFSLIDQSGKKVSLSDYRGKAVVLTFAFAHCQTICPTLVSECLASLRDINTADAHLLVITLDPWRDTPQALPHLAEQWALPEHARVLSGEVADVTAALQAYKVPFERNENTGDVTHPALVYIIDGEGLIAYTFNNAPVSWLRKAVENVIHAKSSVSHNNKVRPNLQSSLQF
jgi:protein SCO1/2